MSDFNLELAKSLSNSNEQYPVSLDDAWQWIGYTRKDSATDTLKSYFDEGVDYVLRLQPESDNHAGLSAQEKATEARRQPIYLTLDCFKQLGMLARTEKGKQIRLYFLECEKIAKQAVANTIPPQFIELLNNMQQQLNVLLSAHNALMNSNNTSESLVRQLKFIRVVQRYS